ncbi:MAG: 4-hydroxythreonine-4-phosphate dehydrogenase PdxA [Calditerrivibrio sp.]|nr:4-hydroxythreonine-4-phosphate dehydrogenase PdxA [Calditerrivibrio sp.]MCA1932366.1 4-hydroxythreonine-4-phosphate dehydrogenase PdxA [Calditerrivibrio sp.]
MKRNKIVITMGDPSGIGPEIICKFFENNHRKDYDIIVAGIKEAFLPYKKVDFDIIEPDFKDERLFPIGKIDKNSGKAAMLSVELAVKMIQEGKADAIVTAPINKKSIQIAGYPFPGHTEYLGYLTNSKNYSMMLIGDRIKTVLVTTHTAIKNVTSQITMEKIINSIVNASNTGSFFGYKDPHIAVCGLNPHAGDNGAIGDEEERIITPAIQHCREKGINVTGPYPADTLFAKMLNGFCHFAVVMYHDQGLIPVKMESFGNAVNVTLNLPIIRTSVDHGTAFDIAGKGLASEGSLRRAVEIANLMVENVKSIGNI